MAKRPKTTGQKRHLHLYHYCVFFFLIAIFDHFFKITKKIQDCQPLIYNLTYKKSYNYGLFYIYTKETDIIRWDFRPIVFGLLAIFLAFFWPASFFTFFFTTKQLYLPIYIYSNLAYF